MGGVGNDDAAGGGDDLAPVGEGAGQSPFWAEGQGRLRERPLTPTLLDDASHRLQQGMRLRLAGARPDHPAGGVDQHERRPTANTVSAPRLHPGVDHDRMRDAVPANRRDTISGSRSLGNLGEWTPIATKGCPSSSFSTAASTGSAWRQLIQQ